MYSTFTPDPALIDTALLVKDVADPEINLSATLIRLPRLKSKY